MTPANATPRCRRRGNRVVMGVILAATMVGVAPPKAPAAPGGGLRANCFVTSCRPYPTPRPSAATELARPASAALEADTWSAGAAVPRLPRQTEGAPSLSNPGALDHHAGGYRMTTTTTSDAAAAALARLDQLLAAKRRPDLPTPAQRRALRIHARLTIDELAQVLGVNRSTIRDWEKGNSTPRNGRAHAYAAVLSRLARSSS